MRIVCISLFICVFTNALIAQISSKEITSRVRDVRTPATNQNRYALIIGNSAYEHITQLPVCENDADSMSLVLPQFGFSPTVIRSMAYSAMKSTIERFLLNINSNSEVVIYYSGHGLHYGQNDYLLPTDFSYNCQNFDSIDSRAMSLQWLIEKLVQKNVKNSLIVMDACRNVTVSCKVDCFGSGFQGSERLADFAVFFSSSNCQVSHFNPQNPTASFFTLGLLHALKTPQLPLGQVFEKAYAKTKEIAQSNGYQQTPVMLGQSSGMVINNQPLINKQSQSKCLSFQDTPNHYRSTGVFRRVYDNHKVSLGMTKIQAQNNALSLLSGRVASELQTFNSYVNGLEIRNDAAVETYTAELGGRASSTFQVKNGKVVCEEEFNGDYYLTLEIPQKDICNLAKSTATSMIQNNHTYSHDSRREILQIINDHFSNCN